LFLDFSRENGLLPFGNFVRVAIAALIVSILHDNVRWSYFWPPLDSMGSFVWRNMVWILAILGIISLSVLVKWGARVRRVPSWWRAKERSIYTKLYKD
jgi:hypothetical protein